MINATYADRPPPHCTSFLFTRLGYPVDGGALFLERGVARWETDLGTTAMDRIDSVLETYLLALAGLDQCPDSVPKLVKDRLAANVERAERAFSDAAADGLQRTNPALEAAICGLDLANEKARLCLQEAKPIVALISDLERAAALAIELLPSMDRHDDGSEQRS